MILNEINIQNLISKVVDIYVNRIGGTPEMRDVYEFNLICGHFKEKNSHCIENEFCEFGHLVPIDFNTIQAGFNIYQVLQILSNTHPEHESLESFKRDETQYQYLLEREQEYILNINYQYEQTSEKEQKFLKMFTKKEVKVLDELVIKCYPEAFLAFIEKTASEQKDEKASQMLQEVMSHARKSKSPIDRQQILEKVREQIRQMLEEPDPRQQAQKHKHESEESVDEEESMQRATLGESTMALLPQFDEVLEGQDTVQVDYSYWTRFLRMIGFRTTKIIDAQMTELAEPVHEDNEQQMEKMMEHNMFVEKLNLFKFF